MTKPATGKPVLILFKNAVNRITMYNMAVKTGTNQVVKSTHIAGVGCSVIAIVLLMQGRKLLNKMQH